MKKIDTAVLARAKKSLGQHWLQDQATLNSICDAAELTNRDTVLEIGPGTGTLTRLLAKRAKQVTAVELDAELVAKLDSLDISPPAGGLQFVKGDIRSFDLTSLPAGYKVVANIPYYLTSHLVRILSESVSPPALAVLLVQKEVAQRLAAKPGKMSVLSVTAQFYWQVSLGLVVQASKFSPPPNVDSQVVILKRRAKLPFVVNEKEFFRLVKAGFSERRKKLRSSLAGGLQIGKASADELLNKSGISPTARAQELSLDDWYKLYQLLAN